MYESDNFWSNDMLLPTDYTRGELIVRQLK